MAIQQIVQEASERVAKLEKLGRRIAKEGAWPLMDGCALPDLKVGQVTVIARLVSEKSLVVRLSYKLGAEETPREAACILALLMKETRLPVEVSLDQGGTRRSFSVTPRDTEEKIAKEFLVTMG